MPTFCDCSTDGYCQRYRREMGGRMREICAGTNVDLGTAAAFREQWLRESGGIPQGHEGAPVGLVLITDQAPGDAVVMTAAIHSLHAAYPGRYKTAVYCPHWDVFRYNPHVVPASTKMLTVHMHYPAVHQSNQRGIHFMQGWCEFLGSALGISVPLLTNRPHLYFPDPDPPVKDFWLMCSGGKQDFTNKLWGHHNYQKVVDTLKGRVRFVQVGELEGHHPKLDGVTYSVGKTTLSQLFNLVRYARGVVCGVSLLMHVAAALGKPSIIIAGGREPVQWNAYPRQHYLHTVGMLPCSSSQGDVGGACWRSRVVPLGDGSQLDSNPCLRPVNGTATSLTRSVVPECMTLIHPDAVVKLVMGYTGHDATRDC